ncbi:hypothetical protein AN641_10245 [Candidatus Epulonipiscioides gigas]|nr:hypothetical protein AN641_10245 [Epulopiscium sp. SCG-C07WGA-EpuloA2]
MFNQRNVTIVASIIVFILSTMYIISSLSVVHINIKGSSAVVTINFFMPMDKEKFSESISILPAFSQSDDIDMQIQWRNNNTVELLLTEIGDIKGQEIRLEINNAKTTLAFINKDKTIEFSFNSKIKVIEPKEALLIATDNSILVSFNTPINLNSLKKYITLDAQCNIEPQNSSKLSKKGQADSTIFKFTPTQELENAKPYNIVFNKGLIAVSKEILQEDIKVQILTDKEPVITKILPENNSHWIGLYPKISITSDMPIKEAKLYVNDIILDGNIIGDYKAIFYFDNILKPNTQYNTNIVVLTPSGQKSLQYLLNFKTVPINDDRIWIIIESGQLHKLTVYQGQKLIKQMICSIGANITKYQKGTYYIIEKGDTFYDSMKKIGANNYVILSEGILIHGLKRDSYWNIQESSEIGLGAPQSGDNIILSEEDAKWLLENIPEETMVILK